MGINRPLILILSLIDLPIHLPCSITHLTLDSVCEANYRISYHQPHSRKSNLFSFKQPCIAPSQPLKRIVIEVILNVITCVRHANLSLLEIVAILAL